MIFKWPTSMSALAARAVSLLASAAAVLGASGCFTTTKVSTVGPYVRAVKAHDRALIVEHCEIKYAKSTHHNFAPILIGESSTTSHSTDLTAQHCAIWYVPTGAAP